MYTCTYKQQLTGFMCDQTYGVFTPEQENDTPGVKGIIGMHRFNSCLVVESSRVGVLRPVGI